MKKIAILLFILVTSAPVAFACEVCKQNQPKILQNITHGPGPQSSWDYAIIIGGMIIVSLTLIYSIKFLIKPERGSKGHIKNLVIDEQQY